MSKRMSEQIQKLAARYEKATGKKFGVITNAYIIRHMTDEELANFFCPETPCNSPWCKPIGRTRCGKAPCRKCMLKWLQQPAEEDGHDERKENEHV